MEELVNKSGKLTYIRYTTAPECYDGFGTKTISPNCGSDGNKTFRKVEIFAQHLTWQDGRYGSGMHCCLTQEQFNKFQSLWIDQGVYRPIHELKTNL